MRKIRIAQIGTSKNGHGRSIFKSLTQLPEDFEIVGYALVEGEREKFAEYLSWFDGYPELTLEEILNDPTIEAVTIETEEIHLTKYAQMAAAHGKMIHMEKPGSQDLAAFEKLIETVKEKNLIFHMGYMYRYNPCVLDLMRKTRQGELGEIVSVEAQMNCLHKDDLREWLTVFKGGMMFYLGCHLIDLILRIQGMPQNVIPLNRSTGLRGIESEDFGMAVLEYPNGVSFAKTCDVERGGFLRRQLVVTGTKACVELQPLEAYQGKLIVTNRIECNAENSAHWNDARMAESSEPFDRYDVMMHGFAEIARGERENPDTPDYELALFQTILKACGIEIEKGERE